MISWVVSGILGLAGAVLTIYYRSRALRAEKAIEMVASVRDEWLAANRALTERAVKAEAALKTRHETERKNDLAETASAGSDAQRIADLLNRP